MIAANGLLGTIGRHIQPFVEEINLDLSVMKIDFSNVNLNHISQFIHLAGVVGNIKVTADLTHSYKVNVNGLSQLAEQFYKSSTGRFIYISSSHVYGPSQNPLSENSLIQPINEYAEQKLIAEKLLTNLFVNNPRRLLIIRVFSVLDFNLPAFTLGGAIQRIAFQHEQTFLENVDDIRDFMTPRAIAAAILEISKVSKMPSVVNLCTGIGRTVKQAAIEMCQSRGIKFPPDKLKSGNSIFPYIVGDNSLLLSLCPHLQLTWKPESMSSST